MKLPKGVNTTGALAIVGVGGFATYAILKYGTLIQLGFFWLVIAGMIFYAGKNSER